MKDYPAQYGHSEMYRDPERTIPMPPPADIPRTQWYQKAVPFQWEATQQTGIGLYPPGWLFEFKWASSSFDMRPDLRSAQGAAKDGAPIWSTSARLYVQLFQQRDPNPLQPNIQQLVNTDNLTVQAFDWTDCQFNYSGKAGGPPGEVGPAGGGLHREPPRDVSALFNNPGLGTIITAGFGAPGNHLGGGAGYPIRYWRLELRFTQFVETGLPIPALEDMEPYEDEFYASPLMLKASVY